MPLDGIWLQDDGELHTTLLHTSSYQVLVRVSMKNNASSA